MIPSNLRGENSQFLGLSQCLLPFPHPMFRTLKPLYVFMSLFLVPGPQSHSYSQRPHPMSSLNVTVDITILHASSVHHDCFYPDTWLFLLNCSTSTALSAGPHTQHGSSRSNPSHQSLGGGVLYRNIPWASLFHSSCHPVARSGGIWLPRIQLMSTAESTGIHRSKAVQHRQRQDRFCRL